MKQLALLVCVLLYARSGDAQAKKATPKPVAAGAVGKMDRSKHLIFLLTSYISDSVMGV